MGVTGGVFKLSVMGSPTVSCDTVTEINRDGRVYTIQVYTTVYTKGIIYITVYINNIIYIRYIPRVNIIYQFIPIYSNNNVGQH